MTMKFLIARALTLLTLLPLAAGCGDDREAHDEESAPLATAQQKLAGDLISAEGTISIGNILSVVPTLALSGNGLTVSAAVEAQLSAADLFFPAGCAAVQIEGNVVTFEFDRCTGPWGPLELSGHQTAAFSINESSGIVAVSVEGDVHGLLNSVWIRHDVDLEVSFDNGHKQVAVLGDVSAVTPLLLPIEQRLDMVVGTDTLGCVALDGTSDTTLGVLGLTLDFDDFHRCGGVGFCPSGAISASTKLTHIDVALSFNGSAEVVAADGNGSSARLVVDCNPLD